MATEVNGTSDDQEPFKGLPPFHDLAPKDRYCDLILTGGVTSAVAYPGIIFALAQAYRFHSIGGSSSGAGSACLAAAAEYRRRRGSAEGYRLLLERMSEVPELTAGKTGLEGLFQPDPAHEDLFNVVRPLVSGAPGGGRKALLGFALRYLLPSLLLVWVLFQVASSVWPDGSSASALHHVVAGFMAAMAFAGTTLWFVVVDLLRLTTTGYGMCSGNDGKQATHRQRPLTPWLHGLIQELAGRSEQGAPLTFRDLAQAPGAPLEAAGEGAAGGHVSIRLQMFTSNVTHGRPYVFPLNKDDPPLYFREDEMRRLFPRSVVAHLIHASEAIEPWMERPVWRAGGRPVGKSVKFWRLPADDLPIVVAARMSVAFPFLFSAVPLWEPVPAPGPSRQSSGEFRRCLFSDGSLCSNFPIHLFDSWIPAWPTFGVALHDVRESGEWVPEEVENSRRSDLSQDSPRIHLPARTDQAVRERWADFDASSSSFGRFAGFIGAMLYTAKDWQDASLSRMPGVRERVVRIGLPKGLGGLNILMTPDQIERLGELGGSAARELLNRYARPAREGGMSDGWAEHRWVRFNLLRECLADSLKGLGWSAQSAPSTQPLSAQIRSAIDRGVLQTDSGGRDVLLPTEAAALQGLLDALIRMERTVGASTDCPPYQPNPRPVMSLRPPL
jgi:predicted acylesterase/phospholipase RssA